MIASWKNALVALLLFGASTAWVYGEVWLAGAREQVPTIAEAGFLKGNIRDDQRIVVWQVTRNARALRGHPFRFFDAEQCFPTQASLALGEPMLTMGVLAIPAELLRADPVLTYNLVLVAMSLLAAFAVFALVRAWTGSAAAALAAGLLGAFHPARLHDPIHPYIYDMTWTALAMLFAQRLFAGGRWRDALGLAASACLQLGTSFYPLVASLLLALPFGTWLVRCYGFRRLRWEQLALVGAAVAVAAAWLFAPYLELREVGLLAERGQQTFTPWRNLVPGRARPPGAPLFPGWTALVLVAAAFALPRPRTLARLQGDPRWALAAGALLVVLSGVGPGWRLLSTFAPGFGEVRFPGLVCNAVQTPLALLAGIGAAGLLSRLRSRWTSVCAVALVVLVGIEMLEPGRLGLRGRRHYGAWKIAPDPETREFFEGLAQRGNAGPIFEMPLPRISGRVYWPATAAFVLLSAYHRRPTSGCLSSYLPDRSLLEDLEARVPERDALRQLRALGFTTIVFHHHLGKERGEPKHARFVLRHRLAGLAAEASAPDGLLRPIHRDEMRVAYAILPDPDAPR